MNVNAKEDVGESSVSIRAKIVFGLNIHVIGNIHFSLNQEVIYPVECVLTFHDYKLKKQKFLRLSENTTPKIIAISPSRKLLSVLEQCNTENGITNSIVIYDLISLKKKRKIDLKETTKNSEVGIISFVSNSKGIVVLSKPPNERLFLFLFDTENTILKGYPKSSNPNNVAECLACNPKDAYVIAVGGKNLFKVMKKDEKGFLSSNSNMNCDGIHITSLIWISPQIVAAGTNLGKLLFIENDEIKAKFNAFDVEVCDLSIDIDMDEDEKDNGDGENERSENGFMEKTDIEKQKEKVICMISFNKGFTYTIFNTVYVFQMTSNLKFERKTIFRIPFESFAKEMYQITNVAVNDTQDSIICTAKHAQIYIGILRSSHNYKSMIEEFKPLGENLHTNEIIAVSVCAWRPIIMTASKDQTVRVWNYETEKIELIKRYQVDIFMVELNPMGVLAAIGFWSQLRIMKIYVDDLVIVKTYNFPEFRDVKFSSFGHLMAIAYQDVIAINSVFNFENIKILKGHFSKVLSISWSKNDKFIGSGGEDGAVYLWDIETGLRIQEFVNKGIQYTDIAMLQDNCTIYSLTNLGTFREISNSAMVCELKPFSNVTLLSIALSRSEQILFISSDKGHIFNVQLPLNGINGGKITNFRYFDSPVTKMKISYDDRLLITTSKAGTLAIWTIRSCPSKFAKTDMDLLTNTEVLVPRTVLMERNETIADLEMRIKQQNVEFVSQQREIETVAKKEIDELTREHEQITNDYKKKISEIEIRHEENIKQKSVELSEMKMKHNNEIQKLNELFASQLKIEEEKLFQQQKNEKKIRQSYEEKFQITTDSLQETIETMEIDFKSQIQEYKKLVVDLLKELEEKKTEFFEYCRQTDIDNDRHLVELKLEYENKLESERQTASKWHEESEDITAKLKIITEDWKRLNGEAEQLKLQKLKYENEIKKCTQKITELEQKELEDYQQRIDALEKQLLEKDLSLSIKEKQIQNFLEIQKKNNEKEKCRSNSNTKDGELKSALEASNQKVTFDLKSKETEEKVKSERKKSDRIKNKETLEKQRVIQLENEILDMCNDIHKLMQNTNSRVLIKDGIRQIYQKYVENRNLKQLRESDSKQIEDEFIRQRTFLESKIAIVDGQREIEKKINNSVVRKLIKEKSVLIEELISLKRKLSELTRNGE